MNDGLIPSRYAKALYKYAQEQNKSALVYEQMKQLELSYALMSDLKKTVDNPFLPVADREKVLLTACGAQAGGTTDKFILMVISNNRESFMREIALSYVSLYRKAGNIAQVTITTAVELPQDKIEAILSIVKKQLSGKTLETSVVVNPDIIGGFIVKVDSMVLDTSVKNELKKLRIKLLKR